MKIDCHMHTPLCGHAIGHPAEYVQAAVQRGIDLITFTCHIPMGRESFGGPGIRMHREQLPEYVTLVDEGKYAGVDCGVEVFCGIEAEVFPDEPIMRLMDETLAAHDFDFILGSLHHQVPAYREWLHDHDISNDFEIVESYFRHLTEGARSARYHSMSHPDVIRIYGTVSRFEPVEHEPTIRKFLQAVVDQDICIEVNTSGLAKGVYEVHPDPLILDWASEMGVKLTIGSDSHRPESVGQFFDEVLPLLKSKGFDLLHYHKAGERISVPIEL